MHKIVIYKINEMLQNSKILDLTITFNLVFKKNKIK
jgi:hypothetical protein